MEKTTRWTFFWKINNKEVLAKSSNVGTVKVALKIPSNAMYHYLNLLGFGNRPITVAGYAKRNFAKMEIMGRYKSSNYFLWLWCWCNWIQLARAYTVFTQNGSFFQVKSLFLIERVKKLQYFQNTWWQKWRKCSLRPLGSMELKGGKSGWLFSCWKNGHHKKNWEWKYQINTSSM